MSENARDLGRALKRCLDASANIAEIQLRPGGKGYSSVVLFFEGEGCDAEEVAVKGETLADALNGAARRLTLDATATGPAQGAGEEGGGDEW